jgi:hypothetical protein
MVRGMKSASEALAALWKAARRKGYRVTSITDSQGNTRGKGSHMAYSLYDGDTLLARSLFPQRPGDMTKKTTSSIEAAFEEYLGTGWMDK